MAVRDSSALEIWEGIVLADGDRARVRTPSGSFVVRIRVGAPGASPGAAVRFQVKRHGDRQVLDLVLVQDVLADEAEAWFFLGAHEGAPTTLMQPDELPGAVQL